MWTAWSSAGRTRWPTRSGSGPTMRSRSSPTTSSSTSRRSSRRCGGAAAMSGRSVRARPRRTGGPGCSTRGSRPDALGRLRGPVGLDLGGRAPAETALAILAEIVAERYGGGRPADEGASGPGLGRGSRFRRWPAPVAHWPRPPLTPPAMISAVPAGIAKEPRKSPGSSSSSVRPRPIRSPHWASTRIAPKTAIAAPTQATGSGATEP